MKRNSIRARITAITAAAILTTVLTVVVVMALTIQRENDRKSVEMMNLIADDTGKSVERYLDSIEQSLDTAANLANDSIDSMLLIECGAAGSHSVPPSERTEEQNERLDEYLAAYCGALQPIMQSISDRSYGVNSYYYCISPEISENMHGFFYSKIGKTGFSEREAIDAGTLDPADPEHTDWYYATIKRGRPSWIGPYRAKLLDDMWICSYVIPVYDSGTLIGVMGLDISVDTFASQLSDVKVYDTGFACLFDDQGRVIYHPDYETGESPENYGKAFSKEQLRQRSNGDELVRYTADGKRRQMSYTTLASGMVLAITAPTREINASWRHMLQILLITTAAILVFFTGLVLYAVRNKWKTALPLYVIAVLIKPQALMLGPLGLVYIIITWIRKPECRRAILIGTCFSFLALAAGVIPFSLQQNWDWLIQLYIRTLGSYPYATVNTANLY